MERFEFLKILVTLLLSIFGFLSYAEVNVSNLPSARVRTTGGHSTYMRVGPSGGSQIIGVIPSGIPMRVFNQPRGNWWPALVNLSGKKMLGWVHRSHFRQDTDRSHQSLRTEAGVCRSCQRSNSSNSINMADVRQSAIWPTQGRISSRYGYRRNRATGARRMHRGVDIAVSEGTRVLSPLDGVIVGSAGGCRTGSSRCNGGAGNTFSIRHGNGLTSTFMHLSPSCPLPKVGERYNQGDTLACVGNTGRSTGPHLHWGVYRNGSSIDPLSIF